MEPIVTRAFTPPIRPAHRRAGAPVDRPVVVAAIAGMLCALYGVFLDALVFRVIGGVLLGFVVVARVIARRRFTQENEEAEPRRRFVITEDAVRCEMEDGERRTTPWARVHDASVSSEAFQLFEAEEAPHTIPMDAFASDADRERFEALLQQKGLL